MSQPVPEHPAPDVPVLLAVDGNSLTHRAFHAQAASATVDPAGRPCWAVRGLLTQLVAAVERSGAQAVVVGFDDPETSVRKQRWPQYKAARADKLDTLVSQLALAADVLRELGVAVVVPAGLEADDVLASAARFAPTVGARTVVVTSDRDAFALIDGTTNVLRIINGGVEASPMLTPARLHTMLGITPAQYRDYAALRGDPSDNLPGVRGIGPKTAARLLAALGTAHAAFDDVACDGARVTAACGPALADRLADPAARAAWELNCAVMAMHTDISLELDLSSGPGALPLSASAVRAVFEQQHLPWTTASALRVLAHQEGPPPTPAEPETGPWPAPNPRRTVGRLRPQRPVPPEPAALQLSLFD